MSTKKKLKSNQIDADPEQFAIVVNYITEIHHFDDFGNPLRCESVPGTKVVKVRRGLQGNEVPALAAEVVEKCKYINAKQVGEVERLLYALMEWEQSQQPHSSASASPQHHNHQGHHPGYHHHQAQGPPEHQPGGKRKNPLLPNADVRLMDDYTNQLYDDRMDLKVLGAKCILRICTEPANLDILADHDTFLGILSQRLRESLKKSFDFAVGIVCTFLCFSHFSQFHGALMQHQCGDVTMKVLEYESHRSDVRKEDYERRLMRLQQLGDTATKEDKKLFAKDEKKYKLQISRQSKLMHVCVMALLNLAEEISIERKMVNRKMPALLVQLVQRDCEDLLITTLQFLKKLSVFEENKEKMRETVTLERLVLLAQHPNPNVASLALRVVYNLSFDESVRSVLNEANIMKLLVDHLRNPPFRHIVLRLLYHFSMDDSCKSLMAYHRDGMVMLLQLVVHFPEQRVGKDLVALVVNLATHPRAAEVIVGSGLFPQVMLRVLKTRDPLLCKVIRHVSSHQGVMESMCDLLYSDSVRMSKWMHEFARMALCGVDNPDLLVEVLGTLGNITLPDMPWCELCEAGLVELLTRLLVPSFSEDDVVLECVIVLSNLALCRESSQHLAGSRLPGMLQDLLIEKREDEEIIIQLLFAFQCLLVHDEVRDAVLQDCELVPCVMRFSRARNPLVLQQAIKTLELVAEYAGDAGGEPGAPSWIEQIKAFRFEQHNSEWCNYINWELSGGGAGGYAYEDEQQGESGEEEEFAFHWAGGEAVVDADDLASRDWEQKDMEQLMRSARFAP
mmetsp:Transcript_113025/g.364968  ORF Transcript_113025/g.364968 Transcript_113025/m.364968 type:complete len:790 (+) Transcript_113025:67-2436(+)